MWLWTIYRAATRKLARHQTKNCDGRPVHWTSRCGANDAHLLNGRWSSIFGTINFLVETAKDTALRQRKEAYIYVISECVRATRYYSDDILYVPLPEQGANGTIHPEPESHSSLRCDWRSVNHECVCLDAYVNLLQPCTLFNKHSSPWLYAQSEYPGF